MDSNNLARFLLTFFLGWLGSLIINHTSLKPEGFTSRTGAYIFLTMITFGIYGLVASICNLTFDPSKEKNIGYKKDRRSIIQASVFLYSPMIMCYFNKLILLL